MSAALKLEPAALPDGEVLAWRDIRLVGERSITTLRRVRSSWCDHDSPQFVILDDDRDAGVTFDHQYIHVPHGLEDEHVERAVRILS